MEIIKETTQWDVDYRQPNHTYLVNRKGQIVAYAKWHSNDIVVLNARTTLNKRGRKFEKASHKELSKLIPKFVHEDKKEVVELNKNSRYFKVKSKDKEYVVEYNTKNNRITCPCLGFSYRGKCKHADAVEKKVKNA